MMGFRSGGASRGVRTEKELAWRISVDSNQDSICLMQQTTRCRILKRIEIVKFTY